MSSDYMKKIQSGLSVHKKISYICKNNEPLKRKHTDMEEPLFNAHNKDEYPPAHSAEHILNGTMDKMFHCGRAFSAHVERKKSKLDYHLPAPLTEEQIKTVEDKVNEIIVSDLPVQMEIADKNSLGERFDLSRLPDDTSEKVRIVHIGDYDECLCVGQHVEHTAQIGHFRISSTRYQDGVQRIVFRLDE